MGRLTRRRWPSCKSNPGGAEGAFINICDGERGRDGEYLNLEGLTRHVRPLVDELHSLLYVSLGHDRGGYVASDLSQKQSQVRRQALV